VEAKTVNVETDNGKVVLEHVKGKIKGSTDNGQSLW
jgi:translation initiation factor IF-1